MDPDPTGPAPDADLGVILDRMSDGFFAVDDRWTVTYTNTRGREILRAAVDDPGGETIEGRRLWEAIPAAVGTVFEDQYREAMETQEPVSFEAYFDPTETWFDVRAFPSETGLSVYVRDITERKQVRRERNESLRALQRLYAITSDVDRSFEEKLSALFDVACEYLGLPSGFLTRLDGEEQTVVAASSPHELLQPGMACRLEDAYCKRTIEREELLTVVHAVEEGWEGDPAHDRFALETYVGGRVEVDGELYGTLCFADTDARGRPFSRTQRTFVELLTRWVSYELERAQVRDRLQRERDRLDEFASIVSHDLRNPLTTAIGQLTLAREDLGEGAEAGAVADRLESVGRMLSRMDAMVTDLLTLAREGSVVDDTAVVPLADVVAAAWRSVGHQSGKLVDEVGDARVRCDESRLRELLENLFRNSLEHGAPNDATAAGRDSDGAVTVTVGVLDSGEGFYVADDGAGIDADDASAVFESGYTTAPDGTGFGLSIVSGIAEAHGWEVTAHESVSGGARFEVTGPGAVVRPD
jgi:signal transduction histidine kinase